MQLLVAADGGVRWLWHGQGAHAHTLWDFIFSSSGRRCEGCGWPDA
jgi:hypothetical protein